MSRQITDSPSKTFLLVFFAFKVIPAFGGILALYLGYRLFIFGVTGQASLSLNSNSISGQLLNAAPGLFFAVGGIVILTAVVLKGISLEFTNAHPKQESSALGPKPGESPKYSGGGGGGGGSSLKAGGSG